VTPERRKGDRGPEMSKDSDGSLYSSSVPLYIEDSYLREFDAEVVRGRPEVRCARSDCFLPRVWRTAPPTQESYALKILWSVSGRS